MSDAFDTLAAGLDAPASRAAAVSPSDSVALTVSSRALYVGGAGDVKVDTVGGDSAVVFKAVPVGTVLPVRASKVYSTGTTATYLVSLW